MTSLVAPYFNFIGFEELPSDDFLTILSRSDAITWACKLAVPQCVDGAKRAYAAWMASSPDAE